MTRFLLLGLGIVLVLGLFLAPQPAPQDQFGLALQTLAITVEDDPLGLRTAQLASGDEAGRTLHVASLEFTGFPADWDRELMTDQADRAIERAPDDHAVRRLRMLVRAGRALAVLSGMFSRARSGR